MTTKRTSYRRNLHVKALVFAAAVATLSTVAIAADVEWKGGGGTSAWSDGTNWQGGIAPSAGDTAVIPNGKTAYMSSGDITWIAGRLSLIRLPGGDSTLYITNRTAVTLSVPVAGVGKFNVANSAVELTLAANNTNFAGPFFFTNSTINVARDYGDALGTYNVVTNFVGPGGTAKISINSPRNNYNKWYIFGRDSYSSSTTSAMLTYSNALRFCGPVHVQGSFNIVPQSNTKPTFDGGIYHSGSDKIHMWNSIAVTGDKTCDFQTTASYDSGVHLRGSVELSAPVSGTTPRISFENPGTLKFLSANLLSPATALQNGMGNNKYGMRIDLNGFDQRCGTIYKQANSGQTEENSYITSPVGSPATLTVYGQLEWYGNQQAGNSRFMAFSLRGAASLDFNGTNVIKTSSGQVVWPMMEIRSCPTKSDTTGGLSVRRGTLTLAEDTYWPNLSRLEARDEGLLVMNTDGVNTNGFVFVASNVVVGAVTIAAGKTLHAKTAYVGKWLEPGEYGGVAAGLDAEHTLSQLGGEGTLTVAEWGGPKGIIFIMY